MKSLFTTNLKFASTLSSLGIPQRQQDPITCIKQDDGKYQYTFWFDATEEALLYERAWNEGWNTKLLDKHPLALTDDKGEVIPYSHPFFYCRAFAENREAILTQMHFAEKMILKRVGDMTLLISERASEKTKKAMQRAIYGK